MGRLRIDPALVEGADSLPVYEPMPKARPRVARVDGTRTAKARARSLGRRRAMRAKGRV